MPTGSGWALLLASAASIALGRLFGLLEAHVLGVVGASLVLLSVLSVRLRPLPRIERVVRPNRPTVGDGAMIELIAHNRHRRRTAPTIIDQPVEGGSGITTTLAAIRPGRRLVSDHRVPTDRRGPITFRPLVTRRRDPLGLAEHRTPMGRPVEILVLPRPEPVGSAIDPSSSIERSATDSRPRPGSDESAEFSTLRPYAAGDDLRRVHWPSSARLDDLVVREDEPSGDDHVSLLLDTRPEHADTDRFERLISAAAALVARAATHDDRIRLTTLDGFDSGVLAARNSVERLLDDLALLERRTDLEPLVPNHLPSGTIAITASIDHTLPDLLADRAEILALVASALPSGVEADPRVAIVVDAAAENPGARIPRGSPW